MGGCLSKFFVIIDNLKYFRNLCIYALCCTHRDILRKKIYLVRVRIPKISNHIHIGLLWLWESLRPRRAPSRQTSRDVSSEEFACTFKQEF